MDSISVLYLVFTADRSTFINEPKIMKTKIEKYIKTHEHRGSNAANMFSYVPSQTIPNSPVWMLKSRGRTVNLRIWLTREMTWSFARSIPFWMALYITCGFSRTILETVSHGQPSDLHQTFTSSDNSSNGIPLSSSTWHCARIQGYKYKPLTKHKRS